MQFKYMEYPSLAFFVAVVSLLISCSRNEEGLPIEDVANDSLESPVVSKDQRVNEISGQKNDTQESYRQNSVALKNSQQLIHHLNIYENQVSAFIVEKSLIDKEIYYPTIQLPEGNKIIWLNSIDELSSLQNVVFDRLVIADSNSSLMSSMDVDELFQALNNWIGLGGIVTYSDYDSPDDERFTEVSGSSQLGIERFLGLKNKKFAYAGSQSFVELHGKDKVFLEDTGATIEIDNSKSRFLISYEKRE